MGSYVEAQLLAGEKVIYTSRVHWAVYLPAIFLLVAGLVVGNLWHADGPRVLAMLMYILAASSWISAIIERKTTELAITDRRVIAKFGFIRRNTFEQQISKIEGVNLKQSILGRILGYASIVVRGTGHGLTPIPHIDEPAEFQKQIAQMLS